MKPALLLIDLQNDFLAAPGLEPARERLIAHAAALLERCRREDCLIVHIWTTIRDGSEAMEHWQRQGLLLCREGSEGHRTPSLLAPRPGEWVVHKRGFSAFVEGGLAASLQERGLHTLLLCGVHLRTCIRTTALDAYQRGFRVYIAGASSGDSDPLHAAVTREYLHRRAITLLSDPSLDALLSGRQPGREEMLRRRSPRDGRSLPSPPQLSAGAVGSALRELSRPGRNAAAGRSRDARRALTALLDRLEAASTALARQLVDEVGKPLTLAEQELAHAAALVRLALDHATETTTCGQGPGWWARRRPLGIVAAITPWNNPLAIPLGKLAPALLAGNSVAWKPALAGCGIAAWLAQALVDCGLPRDRLALLIGDDETAAALLEAPCLDGISLTGGPAAGAAALVQSARRMLPLQAELGGNNAAIVWDDADPLQAARAIAQGAFGFAGQRCTANRRVIVPAAIAVSFRDTLLACIAALGWGDPLEPATVVGPVISMQARDRLEGVIARSRCLGARVHQPHLASPTPGRRHPDGCWLAPTLIEADDPAMEVVQEESFGPILVLQVARNWDEALSLLNGVDQGLAAALFSHDADRQQSFLDTAEVGLLRLNQSTAGARAAAPFGGWKRSGMGPPEHGADALHAFTRIQAVEGMAEP